MFGNVSVTRLPFAAQEWRIFHKRAEVITPGQRWERSVGNQRRIIVDPFVLDLIHGCLWERSQAIKLRPKAFAVLGYLLSRAGQLVTKDELLNAVWPGTFVGEAVLKVTIRQIREALSDDPTSPRFIETAHRRGYRFIGPIITSLLIDQKPPSDNAALDLPPSAGDFLRRVVGREDALARMHSWLEKTLRGERQIIFVTGEAGIGK